MNSLALEKARSRMRSAARAFDALKVATTDKDFQDYWLDYLVAWKGTYTNIKKAAIDTPQEKQWMGGVDAERRSDPLLRWLFEARNDEEHGLITSAIHRNPRYLYKVTETGLGRFGLNEKGEIIAFEGLDGRPMGELVEFDPEISMLHPVTDRGGNVVPVPCSHVDKPIEPSPIHAAHHGLLYIRALVKMAATLGEP